MNTWEKLWHRADAFTARDLLDLALVSRADPGAIVVRALLAPLRKTPRTEQRSAGYVVRPSRGRPLSRRLVDAVCA